MIPKLKGIKKKGEGTKAGKQVAKSLSDLVNNAFKFRHSVDEYHDRYKKYPNRGKYMKKLFNKFKQRDNED